MNSLKPCACGALGLLMCYYCDDPVCIGCAQRLEIDVAYHPHAADLRQCADCATINLNTLDDDWEPYTDDELARIAAARTALPATLRRTLRYAGYRFGGTCVVQRSDGTLLPLTSTGQRYVAAGTWWGSDGPQPTALALALLREVVDEHQAQRLCRPFAEAWMRHLPGAGEGLHWELTAAWLVQWAAGEGDNMESGRR